MLSGLRVGHLEARLPDPGADLGRLGLEVGEELLVRRLRADQVRLDPLDRVLELPRLQLGGQPVPGRVVGRGVGAHPVGERLDQRRALALPGRLHRLPGHRQAGEHVVAVDPDAGEAEAVRPPVQRDPALPLQRLGDRPLVVLAEEHDRRVRYRGPDERLVHVALAGRAVTEVGDDRLAVLAHGAVALDAHRVARRVQRLAADHDRVQVEVVRLGIPAAVADARGTARAAWPGPGRGTRPRRARGRWGRPCPWARAPGPSRPARPPGRAARPRCPARPGAAARSPRSRSGGRAPGRGTAPGSPPPISRAGSRDDRPAHPQGSEAE